MKFYNATKFVGTHAETALWGGANGVSSPQTYTHLNMRAPHSGDKFFRGGGGEPCRQVKSQMTDLA